MSGYMSKKNAYKNEALTAAMELNYGKDVLDAIQAAKTDAEITRILSTARNGGYKKEK